MGKMIDAQSIVVASAATQQVGQRGGDLPGRLQAQHRRWRRSSALIVMLYAYVWPWVIPTGHHPSSRPGAPRPPGIAYQARSTSAITLTPRHLVVAAVLAVPVGLLAGSQAARPVTQSSAPQPAAPAARPAARAAAGPADPMLARFARLSPANISDAMDQVRQPARLPRPRRPADGRRLVRRPRGDSLSRGAGQSATPALATNIRSR